MRALKSLLVMTAVAGLVATMGARSFADILPPLDLLPAKGETSIPNQGVSGGLVGYIDWVVLPPGNYSGTDYEPFVLAAAGGTDISEYLYLYQVEGKKNGLNSFTIYIDQNVPYSAGYFIDTPLDLDAVHNLIGENEVENAPLVQPSNFSSSTLEPPYRLLQWQWSHPFLNTGQESYVLYILSPARPVYGTASLKDGGWGGSNKVPVPSPEPSIIMLLMMGVGMVEMVRRRRKA